MLSGQYGVQQLILSFLGERWVGLWGHDSLRDFLQASHPLSPPPLPPMGQPSLPLYVFLLTVKNPATLCCRPA